MTTLPTFASNSRRVNRRRAADFGSHKRELRPSQLKSLSSLGV